MSPVQSLCCVIGLTVGCLFSSVGMARHKCPKTPNANSILGSTTASTAGTTVMISRFSNTSGCQRSHESEGFYKPSAVDYLDETWNHVVEESAQGHGPHLQVAARLAGCSDAASSLFSELLQTHYQRLFGLSDLSHSERVEDTWRVINQLIQSHPSLKHQCKNVS